MKVYLASGNSHKHAEFLQIVRKYRRDFPLHPATKIGGMPDVEECGATFKENARIKARALGGKVPDGAWVVADDSGLIVDALDGAPGVHSARYAGPGGNAVANNIKLLKELKGVPDSRRTARFRCVLCFCQPGGDTHFFKGDCEGRILTVPEGHEGFGYDPLFVPEGYNKSFADLGSAIKNTLSHRGRAVAEWMKFLEGNEF